MFHRKSILTMLILANVSVVNHLMTGNKLKLVCSPIQMKESSQHLLYKDKTLISIKKVINNSSLLLWKIKRPKGFKLWTQYLRKMLALQFISETCWGNSVNLPWAHLEMMLKMLLKKVLTMEDPWLKFKLVW
jgi:hypothetical protein